MADLGGASEADINRAGRWDSSAMTKYYLTTLPRMTMRVLAGFAPNPGTFWLARDVAPPEDLEKRIFSDVEIWYVLFNDDRSKIWLLDILFRLKGSSGCLPTRRTRLLSAFSFY